jgi:hypothetical protein
MSIDCQAQYNNMLDCSKQEWIRSTLLDVSLLGKPTKPEEANNPDELELQYVSLHEVIPYILISQEGSKPRKRFQARTSYCRDWERRKQFYRQEKLIETVQRKRTLELRSTFSDEVQRAMGILHVQSIDTKGVCPCQSLYPPLFCSLRIPKTWVYAQSGNF